MRKCADQLIGRRGECAVLDGLLKDVRGGQSRALVLHGEAGTGKTALLRHLAKSTTDCRVLGISGVQSELELAFASLHQFCMPLLDLVDVLPAPQRDALHTTFGLCAGPAPDRFLVGLAVLNLLSEAAGKQPVIGLVDDAQWLDRASAQVLAFVARRLRAEAVGLVFATRVPGDDFVKLPELAVKGLRSDHARELLDLVITGQVDEQVRDQIVWETRGNPLALLELPRTLTAADLAGGFGLAGALAIPAGMESRFRSQVDELPAATRLLLHLAAADPTGDLALIWRAAGLLGIDAGAAQPAVNAGLIQLGDRMRFRHPLMRSAAYRSASDKDRRAVHQALAAVTNAQLDPDRRAWHRASAAPGPDEDVAMDLERSAVHAQARGGLAAGAAFRERAALLTPDPADRVCRAVIAAQAMHHAGARDAALALLALAEAGPQDELGEARTCLLRGQIAFASGRSFDAPMLLIKAARRFESVDVAQARETYLDAMSAAMYAGRLASEAGLAEVAIAAAGVPPGDRAVDKILDGLIILSIEGYPAGIRALQQALMAFSASEDASGSNELRWLFVAIRLAHEIWDDGLWRDLATRQVQLAHDAGVLSVLPLALNQRIFVHLHAGELDAAASLVAELETIEDPLSGGVPAYGAMALAGWQGVSGTASQLISTIIDAATLRAEGIGLSLAYYTGSVLNNGLGRYEEAYAAAELATGYPKELGFSQWGLVELVEAAVHCGHQARAAAALELLSTSTRSSGTHWGLGVESRCRALLSEGDAAEGYFLASIEHLSSSIARVELARGHLLYGEWLRRERRRGDAREQLRTAYNMFEVFGMEGFAARARRELRATGETARKRVPAAAMPELTAQEAQIARLASEGLSNPEIGIRLFLSPRTVQYHLGKVFMKLGVASRGQLRRVVSTNADNTPR